MEIEFLFFFFGRKTTVTMKYITLICIKENRQQTMQGCAQFSSFLAGQL